MKCHKKRCHALLRVFVFAVAIVLLVAIISVPTHAQVRHGFASPLLGGWDFSLEQSVHWLDGDLAMGYVVDPPLGYMLWAANGSVIAVVDSVFGDVNAAPLDSTLYAGEWPALLNKTYVIRTGDGFYAKFQILKLASFYFEYAWQTDGSSWLGSPVPVKDTSWGRVKALYRQ